MASVLYSVLRGGCFEVSCGARTDREIDGGERLGPARGLKHSPHQNNVAYTT